MAERSAREGEEPRVNRNDLIDALEEAGVRHPFLEDCPCGCEDYFGFGRGPGTAVSIAFSTDGAPQVLWREGEASLSLARVSQELREVLRTVRDVLVLSDPDGAVPFTHVPAAAPKPPPPGLAARVVERVRVGRCRRGAPARQITFRGETHTVQEWSAQTGIEEKTLYWRLSAASGWSVEEALTKPARHRRRRS